MKTGKMTSLRHSTILAACTFAALTAHPARLNAEETEYSQLKEKGWLSVGFFYPFFDSTARLDLSATDRGTVIDLEKDLGMDGEISTGSVRGGMYFSERWRVEAEYLNLDRSASGVLSREIEWGDETYEAGVRVNSFFDVAIARLAVGYDFFQREDRFMGFILGAHLLDAAAGISAAVFIDGTRLTGDNGKDASTGGLIPVPNLGLYGSYLLSHKWRLDGRMDWFGISVAEWDGTLVTADLQVVYLINESWRIGAGVQYFAIDVRYSTDQWLGALDYQYLGPRLEVGFAF